MKRDAIPTNTLGRFASKVSRLPLRVEDYIWRPENIDARTPEAQALVGLLCCVGWHWRRCGLWRRQASPS